jgi:hypothetical protein
VGALLDEAAALQTRIRSAWRIFASRCVMEPQRALLSGLLGQCPAVNVPSACPGSLQSTGVREVWWRSWPGEEREVHAEIISAVRSLPSLSYVAWIRKLGEESCSASSGAYGSVT